MTQSENAIKWLEALLSDYKQNKDGKLGDLQQGFCCWGLGCHITRLKYEPEDTWDYAFAKKVGYLNEEGDLLGGPFFNMDTLAELNDGTNAGFKRIAKYLIKNADKSFKPKVAKAIQEHFNK